jgi:hypothetical protein
LINRQVPTRFQSSWPKAFLLLSGRIYESVFWPVRLEDGRSSLSIIQRHSLRWLRGHVDLLRFSTARYDVPVLAASEAQIASLAQIQVDFTCRRYQCKCEQIPPDRARLFIIAPSPRSATRLTLMSRSIGSVVTTPPRIRRSGFGDPSRNSLIWPAAVWPTFRNVAGASANPFFDSLIFLAFASSSNTLCCCCVRECLNKGLELG